MSDRKIYPATCPECESFAVDSCRPVFQDTTVYIRMTCLDCSAEWDDAYEFDRVLMWRDREGKLTEETIERRA